MVATGAFVAYYRVSTARQGRSGLGIEAQRAAVESYLNGGKWRIAGEYTEVESGKRSDRPQLDAALKAARLRRCPVVVAKVDRLARSQAFLSRVIDSGVDVRFADLPQIEGPTGRFLLQQMMSVAELEAGLIGIRTKDALAQAKLRGRKLGGLRRVVVSMDASGKKTYGDPATLTAEARALGTAVRQRKARARAIDLEPVISDLRSRGITSLRSIATALTDRGIPTARGHADWTAVQVSRVIARLQSPGR